MTRQARIEHALDVLFIVHKATSPTHWIKDEIATPIEPGTFLPSQNPDRIYQYVLKNLEKEILSHD